MTMKKSIKSEVLHPPDPSLLSDNKRGERQDGFPSASSLEPEKKKKRKYEHSHSVRRNGDVREETSVSETKNKKKRYRDHSSCPSDKPAKHFSKKAVSSPEDDDDESQSTRSSSSSPSEGSLEQKEEKRHDHRHESTKKRRKTGEPEESASGEQQDNGIDGSSESLDASSVSTARDGKKKLGDESFSSSSSQKAKEEGDELASYQLSALSLKSLRDRGYHSLLPIQKASFYPVLSGKDFIGRARTGTGKTIAFSLPLVEVLCSSSSAFSSSFSETSTSTTKSGDRGGKPMSIGALKKKELPRILVLLPTRELAQQVYEEFVHLSSGRFTCVCLYGGANELPQLQVLRRGVSVIVACPGRFKDFMNRCGVISGGSIETLVLDEGDRMLELGFREDIEEIFEWILTQKKKEKEEENEEQEKEKKTRKKKGKLQFLLFTATLPNWVLSLAERFMAADRVLVDIVELMKKKKKEEEEDSCSNKKKGGEDPSLDSDGDSDPHKEKKKGAKEAHAENEEEGKAGIDHLLLFCSWNTRVRILGDLISLYGHRYISSSSSSSTIIFAETKSEVNEISVNSSISSLCAPLHGDISQQQRETTLSSFKKKKFPCLVATDVAARGLHVDDLQLVIQTSPPRDIDTYIHRAGRTGRAGKRGTCITLCKISDVAFLRQIEIEGSFTFQRIGVPQSQTLQKYHLAQYLQQIQSLPISPLQLSSSLPSSSSTGLDKRDKRSSLKKKTNTTAGDELLLESSRSLLERCDSPEEAIYRCLKFLLLSLPHQHRHSPPSLALSGESMLDGESKEQEGEKSSPRSPYNGKKDRSTTEEEEDVEKNQASASSVLSCLNGREGYKTFSIELQEKKGYRHPATIYSNGYIWRMLKEFFREKKQHDVIETFQSMTLYRSGRGCVFDVEHANLSSFYRYILQAMQDKETEEEEKETGKAARSKRRKEEEEKEETGDSCLDGGDNRYYPFTIGEVEDLPELYDGLQQLREEGKTKSSDSAYNGGKNPNHIWSRKLGEGRGGMRRGRGGSDGHTGRGTTGGRGEGRGRGGGGVFARGGRGGGGGVLGRGRGGRGGGVFARGGRGGRGRGRGS